MEPTYHTGPYRTRSSIDAYVLECSRMHNNAGDPKGLMLWRRIVPFSHFGDTQLTIPRRHGTLYARSGAPVFERRARPVRMTPNHRRGDGSVSFVAAMILTSRKNISHDQIVVQNINQMFRGCSATAETKSPQASSPQRRGGSQPFVGCSRTACSPALDGPQRCNVQLPPILPRLHLHTAAHAVEQGRDELEGRPHTMVDDAASTSSSLADISSH
ncbi:uncharacterized protein K489DRAFT_369140 [Dissoconium aciculare CBS 342.82]|uniref:Uncharacterized protein n=1 Tax=Dissoconium aciculare CBS 342.82 TaxID=1314786 RepID=A0A6J3M9E2_9PEZI|nr:uncharacterized protein K489DRAFT_369140 [Dissoconium aciculare CBS 342.82]KAF1824239.1 hypothetical protein K489DRAFT_369140 [Dissoconium aciculare CBS 342.82]